MKIKVNKGKSTEYSICLEPDFENLKKALEPLETKERKICIVADSITAGLYLQPLKESLEGCCRQISQFVFQAGGKA